MSLVGPRPLIIEEDRHIVGHHRRRLDLTPGLTGLWQVLGRSDIPFAEMVTLDYLYVTNWSLWGDLKLLARTLPAVMRGRGAYLTPASSRHRQRWHPVTLPLRVVGASVGAGVRPVCCPGRQVATRAIGLPPLDPRGWVVALRSSAGFTRPAAGFRNDPSTVTGSVTYRGAWFQVACFRVAALPPANLAVREGSLARSTRPFKPAIQ